MLLYFDYTAQPITPSPNFAHRAFILIFPTSASGFSIRNITETEQASRERTLRGSGKYLRQWESNSTTPPLPPHGR